MRFVGAKMRYGRVGHQISAIWQARAFSELFGFRYCHSPFIDEPNMAFSAAAAWNPFFDLGRDEPATADILAHSPSLVHAFAPYGVAEYEQSYELLQRLASGVPPGYALLFEDLAWLQADRIQAWIRRGFAAPNMFSNLVSWFQRQLDGSEFYRQVEVLPWPADALSVAIYWRRPGETESLPGFWQRSWEDHKAALTAIRQAVGPDRRIAVKVLTQSNPGPVEAPVDELEVVCCDDQYPLVYQAMKTLIEADVAVTSGGGSSIIVGIYRALRRPTIAAPGWFISGIRQQPNKPLVFPEGYIT